MIKAILFDMDGVIVNSMPWHVSSWLAVLRDYGLEVPPVEIYKREGMSGLASIHDIFKTMGFTPPSDEIILELMKKKYDLFDHDAVQVFPEVAAILDACCVRGWRRALVTGSQRRIVGEVLPPRVLGAFDAIITANDVNHGKPHPEPYLKGLDALGIENGTALVVENAPMGIASAKAAGLFCVAIETSLSREYLAEADAVLKDHGELLAYLKSI